jgi:hypothetical protein
MAHEIQTAIGASVDTRGLWADFLFCVLVLIAQKNNSDDRSLYLREAVIEDLQD